MPQIPNKLDGDSHYENSHNKTIEYIKSLRPARGSGTFTRHSFGGTSRTASRQRSVQPQTKSSGNWNYRGLYDPATTTPYMTFDVVQYGTGTSAGMYLSTIDNNNNTPDTGIGWTQVSTGTGTWL